MGFTVVRRDAPSRGCVSAKLKEFSVSFGIFIKRLKSGKIKSLLPGAMLAKCQIRMGFYSGPKRNYFEG